MFASGYASIEKCVVGIGIRNDPEYQILGTGFVVHPDGWIMTNRHVIEALLVPHPDGEMRMCRGAAAFLFVDAEPPPGLIAARGMAITDIVQASTFPVRQPEQKESPPLLHGIKVHAIVPAATPDIAVCQIDVRNLPPQIGSLACAKLVDSAAVRIGQTVGILGFPQGLRSPATFESTAQVQLLPLLQTGVVAGMLPYSGIPKPSAFVLDITVNPGSSGSPVFLPNGDVVGIVYATKQRFCELHEDDGNQGLRPRANSGVFVVSGLGLAVPTAHLPAKWIGGAD